MLDARLGKMATELAGVNGIRIWHDQALIKEPWANPTAWHLDNPYWFFSSRNAISIWIALDDVGLHNGCLHFLQGAHREASFEISGITENMSDLFKIYPQWADREAQAVPMKVGDCSFHNALLPHGADANMTCAYMPDGEIFNGQKNVLPDAYIQELKVGDLLENDEFNPLIYHKTKTVVSV